MPRTLGLCLGIAIVCFISVSAPIHAQEQEAPTVSPSPMLQLDRESTSELFAKVIDGPTKLTSGERDQIVAYAARDGLEPKHKGQLLTILFFSLRSSLTRGEEAERHAAALEEITKECDEEDKFYGPACVAFRYELPVTGAKLEQEGFDRIHQASWKEQCLFLNSLTFTRWKQPDERLANLMKVYADETACDVAREAIVNLVYGGMFDGGLKTSDGMLFYRDIAALPCHSPKLNKVVMQRLAELSHEKEVLRTIWRGFPDGAPEKEEAK